MFVTTTISLSFFTYHGMANLTK
jgi:hypothetical protein